MSATNGAATTGRITEPALCLDDVTLTRDGRDLLHRVDWTVDAQDRWVLLGANGSGKSSLIRIASLYEHPSSGTVDVLGERLGATDVRALRRRIAVVGASMADMIRPQLDASDVVMCAKYAALEPWWHRYDSADRARADELLDAQGVGFAARRPYGSLSSGERQRVLLARALMSAPELLLLDEPTAGLDLAGREAFVERIDQLAMDPTAAPMVLVTHHVEEIPASFTHLLALRAGQVVRNGALPGALDAALLTECFEMDLTVTRHDDGRFSARRAR